MCSLICSGTIKSPNISLSGLCIFIFHIQELLNWKTVKTVACNKGHLIFLGYFVSIHRVFSFDFISHLMPPILFFFNSYTCFRGQEEEETGRLLEVKTRLIRAFAHLLCNLFRYSVFKSNSLSSRIPVYKVLYCHLAKWMEFHWLKVSGLTVFGRERELCFCTWSWWFSLSYLPVLALSLSLFGQSGMRTISWF